MTLNISPPNLSGLAAMAGSGGGNLNLANPGALGLQALQIQAAQREAQQRAAIELMRTQQQGALGLREAQIQQQRNDQMAQAAQQELAQQGRQGLLQRDLEMAKMAQQGNQFDRTLSQDDRRIDVTEKGQDQKAQQEAFKLAFEKLKEEDENTRREKGAYAASSLMAIKNAKTPEEAQMIRAEILKGAVANKMLSQEDANVLSKQPLSKFTDVLISQVMILDAADMFSKMTKATQEQNNSEGGEVILPDGTIIKTQSPNKATATEVQKSEVGIGKRLIELRKLEDSLDSNKSNLTYKGKGAIKASVLAEKTEGIPLVGPGADKLATMLTGKDKKGRSEDIDQATTFINTVEQLVLDYQHDKTGAAAAEAEIKRIRDSYANGDLSVSQMKASLRQLVKKNINESDFNKYILNEGVNTSKQHRWNIEKGAWE